MRVPNIDYEIFALEEERTQNLVRNREIARQIKALRAKKRRARVKAERNKPLSFDEMIASFGDK